MVIPSALRGAAFFVGSGCMIFSPFEDQESFLRLYTLPGAVQLHPVDAHQSYQSRAGLKRGGATVAGF